MATYAQGYAAGRRRVLREATAAQREALKEEFERQVFLAILPELVARPWQTNSKSWTNMDQFISGAHQFAKKSSAKFSFTIAPSVMPDNT